MGSLGLEQLAPPILRFAQSATPVRRRWDSTGPVAGAEEVNGLRVTSCPPRPRSDDAPRQLGAGRYIADRSVARILLSLRVDPRPAKLVCQIENRRGVEPGQPVTGAERMGS